MSSKNFTLKYVGVGIACLLSSLYVIAKKEGNNQEYGFILEIFNEFSFFLHSI